MFYYPSNEPNDSEDAAEVEQYRDRHRHVSRNQQQDVMLSMHLETFEVEAERTRKLPASRRQGQYQVKQQEASNNDGRDRVYTELPEALNAVKPHEQSAGSSYQDHPFTQQSKQKPICCVKRASLWERRVAARAQKTDQAVKHVPKLGHEALWGGPMHYTTQDARRQELYFQPHYFA